MLWNPIATARFLPGQVIPAAKAAHGAEAILAVLAIFVWHFYSVHIKMFNKSMFTGKLTRQQMEEEHGEELERIVSGMTRPPADPAGVRRRERIFLPVTIVSALVLGVVVLWFATFEQTAIATLPEPIDVAPAFVPLTPTPIPIATVDNRSLGAPVPHPVEGDPYSNCLTCHKIGGVAPFPENHKGRPVESCLICHKEGPAPAAGGQETGAAVAGPIPHPIKGEAYKDCTLCHGQDKMKPFPANHVTFATDSCTLCHKPAAAEEAPEVGVANPIPHPIEGEAYKDCTLCHGEGKMRPFPANHTAFAADSCTTCHKPAAGEEAPAEPGASQQPPAGPQAVPHSVELEVFADCTRCHGGADTPHPYPENHASFTVASCTGCHPAPKDETAITVAAPKPVPHSLTKEIYVNCATCHAPNVELGIRAPAFHAGYEFTAERCTTCHVASVAE